MPRETALELLDAVLVHRHTLDVAEQESKTFHKLSPRDRALCMAIVKSALRHLGEIDALIKAYLEKPLPRKATRIQHILRTGLTQFLYLDIPDHAAVSETVDLCKGSGGAPYKKLVNAILRRTGREGKAFIAALDAPRVNTPTWLWDRWVKTYGETTAHAIATAHMHEAPLDLAVKSDAAGWAEKLGGTMLPTGAVRVKAEGPVTEMQGFDEGAWWVQDAAAQLPVRMLGDVDGLSVIDLCAAPGGKTMELAAAGARVTALDRSEKRLERVKQNLERTGFFADIVCDD
ncbi:MAG: MFS transporter, partial [Rhodospirillaceae bacterium]|nr:MFS transporter [Rhodospirillaceae bacterium]